MQHGPFAWSVAGLIGVLCIPAALADPDVWTLERAISRGIQVAPEIRSSDHRIDAQLGALDQAGRWPNPTLDIEATDTSEHSQDYALTKLSLTQPLPLWSRVEHRREMAGARLAEARALASQKRLELESRIGAAFHDWQLAHATHELAALRLREVKRLERAARLRMERGDLSERERLRIDLFGSQATRAMEDASSELMETQATLAAWLDIDAGELGLAPPLEVPPRAIPSGNPGQLVDGHPALWAAGERQRAAQAGVALARADARPDLSIQVFTEREARDGRWDNALGIGLQLELPLWDRNPGGIRQRTATSRARHTEFLALRRDLVRRIETATAMLGQLLRQLEHHRDQTLAPALRVRDLSYRGYETGEVSLLELLEAIDTHVDASLTEQQLLARAQAAWHQLHTGSGRSLAEDLP